MKDLDIFRARFGVAVRRRRVEKKLTQYQLADEVGVEQPTIHRLEKGTQGFDSTTLFKLCQALGCSVTDLMAEVEDVVSGRLPQEANDFARAWMHLPKAMREEYRQRIEALAAAMSNPVADERDPRAGRRRARAR